MRIFFLLLFTMPLLAKTTLYGDIDGDNKNESMELQSIGVGQYDTHFYQLVVKDDNGRVLWQSRVKKDEKNRYIFFEAHDGVSIPQILADIDQDGYMELIAPEPQSDVSPTYFRKLKWIDKRFRIMPSQVLMMKSANRFEWESPKGYEGKWISRFVEVQEGGLVKANVLGATSTTYPSGIVLLKMDKRGASVVKWIEPLK